MITRVRTLARVGFLVGAFVAGVAILVVRPQPVAADGEYKLWTGYDCTGGCTPGGKYVCCTPDE